MRRAIAGAVITTTVLLGLGGTATADPTGSVTHPGQHGQSCGSSTAPTSPGGGNSSNSPGSPFNGGSSASHYAGQQPQNSNNGQNSQYDVACFQQSSH